MYFGYNHQSISHPHSMSLPSQISQGGLNSTSFNKSLLLEPKVVTLQRESENYIRQVEQEKKHFFSVDETYALVKKEWKEKREKFEEISKIKQKPEYKLQHSKVKNLQNSLEQAISNFNETQALNQQLQRQIDSLRKERVQFLHIYQYLLKEVKETQEKQQKLEDLKAKSSKIMDEEKSKIESLKNKNDQDIKQYVPIFKELQNKVLEEKSQKEVNKIQAKKEKTESIDTATLLKMRLKRIIANNKEKVKVIEHYLKNMRVIDEAFTQIKEASGITDIEEISSTFIKSEEQNYSLYNYVDILSQEIDNLNEANEELKKKIKIQESENEQRIKLSRATPPVEKQRKKIETLIIKRNQDIDLLREKMDEIGPELQQILIELTSTQMAPQQGKSQDHQLAFNLSESSLENYLQEFEYYINLLVAKQQISLNESIVHNTLLLDQIPQKEFKTSRIGLYNPSEQDLQIDNGKLLDEKKIRQLAQEIVEKKKKQ